MLVLGQGGGEWPASGARRALADSERYWRGWMRGVEYDGPHRLLVRRSGLLVNLLTYAPTGSVVAAPTTSLPERVGAAGTRTTASAGSATPH